VEQLVLQNKSDPYMVHGNENYNTQQNISIDSLSNLSLQFVQKNLLNRCKILIYY